MDLTELQEWLTARVRADAYDLSGGNADEALVLRRCASGWEIFYSERGLQTGRRTFASEDEACRCFRSLVEADPTIRISSRPQE